MKKQKAKMGRPPIKPSKRRSILIALRITKAEREILEREAKQTGQSIGDLLMKPWREVK